MKKRSYNENSNEKTRDLNNYESRRDLNLLEMILSLSSNRDNSIEKVDDLFKLYYKMDELNYSDNFKKSLKNSLTCLKKPNNVKNTLQQLKNSTSDSFLIVPLIGRGHAWSALIRKNDEGFSVTIINKGGRFFHHTYEEYIFENKNISNLVECLDLAAYEKATVFNTLDIEDVYRNFEEKSDNMYKWGLHTSNQKTGNCFIKNPQAAIKFAYATSNYSPEDLKKFRISEEKPPVKWKDKSVKDVHILFANKLKEKNPDIAHLVDIHLTSYIQNKDFRQNLKSGKNIFDSLEQAFDPQSSLLEDTYSTKLIKLLSNVNSYSFNNYLKELEIAVSKANCPELTKAFLDIKKFFSVTKLHHQNSSFSMYLESGHPPLESLKAVFDRNDSLKDLDESSKIKKLLSKLDTTSLKSHPEAIIEICLKVYDEKEITSQLQDLIISAEKKDKGLLKCMEETYANKDNIKNYFPVTYTELSRSLSDLYLSRGLSESTDFTFIDRAIELQPNNPAAYFGRSIRFLSKSDLTEALNDMNKAVEAWPTFPAAYITRALLNVSSGEFRKAVNDFYKFHTLTKSTYPILFKLIIKRLTKSKDNRDEINKFIIKNSNVRLLNSQKSPSKNFVLE